MNRVFLLNGGVGRVVASLPVFEKLAKTGEEFYIVSQSGLEFFLGNDLLQDKVFDPGHKGLFERIIKPNQVISPEPYHHNDYYNQRCSLTEAFDKIINNTNDHSDLERPRIILNKVEELNAMDALIHARKQGGNKKTIVIQPFGRSSNSMHGEVVDPSSRSLGQYTYLELAKNLAKDYNIIYMGEHAVAEDEVSLKPNAPLRVWAGIIEIADYFIGCDSLGQHLAYAFDKPGTVILGSTFAKNISYPDHFQILERPGFEKRYSPIRLEGVDSELADRLNDTAMDFTPEETEELISKIREDIKLKA